MGFMAVGAGVALGTAALTTGASTGWTFGFGGGSGNGSYGGMTDDERHRMEQNLAKFTDEIRGLYAPENIPQSTFNPVTNYRANQGDVDYVNDLVPDLRNRNVSVFGNNIDTRRDKIYGQVSKLEIARKKAAADGDKKGVADIRKRIAGLKKNYQSQPGVVEQAVDLNTKLTPKLDRQATALNDSAVAGKQRMLQQVDPGYFGFVDKANNIVDSKMRGDIPIDVQRQLANTGAFRALSGGTGGGSGLARNAVARDLGLTSLQLQDQGFAQGGALRDMIGRVGTPRMTQASDLLQFSGLSAGDALQSSFRNEENKQRTDIFNIGNFLSTIGQLTRDENATSQFNSMGLFDMSKFNAGQQMHGLDKIAGAVSTQYTGSNQLIDRGINDRQMGMNLTAQQQAAQNAQLASMFGDIGAAGTSAYNQYRADNPSGKTIGNQQIASGTTPKATYVGPGTSGMTQNTNSFGTTYYSPSAA